MSGAALAMRMKLALLFLAAILAAAGARADTIVLQADRDASIAQGNPNNSNGGGPCFFAGTDGNSSPHRALISFSLNGIPQGATITSVQLTLTLAQVAGSGGGGGEIARTATIGLFGMGTNWNPGTVEGDAFGIGGTGQGDQAQLGDATWNDAFYKQTPWHTPGGDHASTVSASLFLNNNTQGTVYTWQSTSRLVADVQGWLDNPSTNFGWELINADETSQRTFFAFYSCEWHTFTGGNAAQEPALLVTFTVPEPGAGSLLATSLVIVFSARRRLRSGWPFPRMIRRLRAPAAFTLLELLIVVAIIVLLAGLILAVLGPINAMRDQARSISNLRQWGVALAAYANDNDGYIPRRGQGVQPVAQFMRPEDWFNALPPYLGSKGYGDLVAAGRKPQAGDNSLFVRPGAKDPGATAFLSYGMNMNLSPWDQTLATRLTLIEHPAVTVFMAETTGQYASTYPSKKAYSCQAPYRNQGDILFLDGHVSAYSATYLGVGKTDPKRADVSWLTGTVSDAQAPQY